MNLDAKSICIFFYFTAFQEEAHLEVSAHVTERSTDPSDIWV